MSQPISTDVAVIGGGVIGLCVAERLAHEGFTVAIFEKDRIAAGASAGNAASFAFSEVMPMASAGTIRKSIRWFFDPTGPFSVVPRDLPKTAGWLLRFALAARRSAFDKSLQTLAAIMQLEQQTLPALLTRTKLQAMVRESGALYLYASPKVLAADLANWRLRQAQGTEFEVLEGAALHAFQSGLSDEVGAAVYVPKYQIVSDPRDYCLALHQAVESNRVVTRYDKIERLQLGEEGVTLHGASAPLAQARHVVLAAGPWSGRLAAQLGDTVSLIGERGYNTTLPKSAFPTLDKPLFFTSEGFVMTPLADGVRVGGASEIASLESPANFERSRAMLRKARALVPGLQDCEGVEWMGMRPTTPDTLPVVGYSRRSPRVVYAFGHGHLGLTMASSTAELVTDLVCGRHPGFDVQSLSAARFR